MRNNIIITILRLFLRTRPYGLYPPWTDVESNTLPLRSSRLDSTIVATRAQRARRAPQAQHQQGNMDQGQQAPQAQQTAAAVPPAQPPLPPPPPAPPVFALGPGSHMPSWITTTPTRERRRPNSTTRPSRPSKRNSMVRLTIWPSSLLASAIELALLIGNDSSRCQSTMELPGTS